MASVASVQNSVPRLVKFPEVPSTDTVLVMTNLKTLIQIEYRLYNGTQMPYLSNLIFNTDVCLNYKYVFFLNSSWQGREVQVT